MRKKSFMGVLAPVRCTPDQLRRWMTAARLAGMPRSLWIRKVLDEASRAEVVEADAKRSLSILRGDHQ